MGVQIHQSLDVCKIDGHEVFWHRDTVARMGRAVQCSTASCTPSDGAAPGGDVSVCTVNAWGSRRSGYAGAAVWTGQMLPMGFCLFPACFVKEVSW
jgi:hypothetical protein